MKRIYWMLLLLCLSGCGRSDNSNPTPFLGEAMTMPYRILIGKNLSWDKKREVNTLISQTFNEVDTIYNKWNPNSEVSKLNQSKASEKITLSTKLYEFLIRTHRIVEITEGRFDPTIEPVQKLWKTHLQQGKIPSDEQIVQTSKAVGWSQVHVKEGIFWKDQDNLQLDLGGIAKGYAIDMIVERLNKAGYPDVYVEWGGEIRVSGKHPDKRPWRIFVSRMGGKTQSEAIAVVDLADQAVASSGDYLQQWTVERVTYCHIIHPQTCRPLTVTGSSVCCATLIAQTCMEADALATAAMTFSTPEEAELWLSRIKDITPEIRYWVVSRKKNRVR